MWSFIEVIETHDLFNGSVRLYFKRYIVVATRIQLHSVEIEWKRG